MPADIKKVVLAYSGRLDTSAILRRLQKPYRCEIVTFTTDLGQGEELKPARCGPSGETVARCSNAPFPGAASCPG